MPDINLNLNTAAPTDSTGGLKQLPPDIYRNGKLVEYGAHEITSTKNPGEAFHTLHFLFNFEAGPHEHVEWEPREDDYKVDPAKPDKPTKVQNMLARIKHIIKRFDAQLIDDIDSGKKQLNFTSWPDLVNWAADSLKGKTADVSVDVKITGSVYTKKDGSQGDRCGFPGYTGFIAESGTPDAAQMVFSRKEKSDNEAWYAAQSSSMDGAGAPPTSDTVAALDGSTPELKNPW